MTVALILAGVVIIGVVVYFLLFRKKKADVLPAIVPLLPSTLDCPKIFQAWNGADNLVEDIDVTIARHGLFFHVIEVFGMLWQGRTEFTAPSMAGIIEPSSIAAGLAKRARLKELNPNIILLAQIGYTEGDPNYTDFPDNHPWWLRDAAGNRVLGWGEGDTQSYKFDLSKSEVLQHCANCCKVVMETRVFDGIMLDVWVDDQVHLNLIRRIRATIGDEPYIICNLNADISPLTIGYINGAYMETASRNKTVADWQQITRALKFNEANARLPKLNCLELWYTNSRQDLNLMRAITCLLLTHSNGYALFSEPNRLIAPDHLHDWYPFWDSNLGKPTGQPIRVGSGGVWREFEHGTAVYNPIGAEPLSLSFPESRLSVASGFKSTQFTLPPCDGGIYMTII